MKTYLEHQDDTSHKFWQIEVNGNSHTVRYGKAGTHGRESIKEFTNEELAHNDAQKLIAAKKKKGYVPSNTLVNENNKEPLANNVHPLTNEEKEIIKNITTKHLSAFQKSFWHKKMQKFLRENFYASKTKQKDNNSIEGTSPFFEKIAQFEHPNMQKQVVRDENNLIKHIAYTVDDKKLFTLQSNTHVNLQPFYCEDEFSQVYRGYPIGAWGYFVDKMEHVLHKFPAFCVGVQQEIEEEEHKHNKNQKIKNVAENNIDVVIKNLMKQLGFRYAVEENKTASVLKIKAHENYFLEFSLPHKTFLKRIDKIKPTIELVQQSLEKINIPVFLGKKQTDVSWNYSSSYHLSRLLYDLEWVENKFWEHRWGHYMQEKITKTAKTDDEMSFDIRKMANFNHKDFQIKVTQEEGTKEVRYISYYLKSDNSIAVYLQGTDWMSIKGFSTNRIYPRKKGRLEPEDFQAFFDGFVECYNTGKKELSNVLQETKDKCTTEINKRNNTESALKEHIIQTGREYSLKLLEPKYQFPIYLDIRVKAKQVLCLCFRYTDYESHINEILPMINIIEQTIDEAQIPFKIFNTVAKRNVPNWKQEP